MIGRTEHRFATGAAEASRRVSKLLQRPPSIDSLRRCELPLAWRRETREPRVIVMTAKAHEVLARQPTKKGHVFLSRLGKPYTPAGLRSIVKRAAKDAGITLPGPYRLRHTFGQWMVDSGASIDEVGAALGHEPGSRETQIYAQLRRDRVAKAIESLDKQVVAVAEASKTPAAAAAPAERKAKGRSRKAV